MYKVSVGEKLFVQLLREVSRGLENTRPEEVRVNIETLDVLIGINRVLLGMEPEDRARIRGQSSGFVEVYNQVMLRDLEEPIPNDCEPREDPTNG